MILKINNTLIEKDTSKKKESVRYIKTERRSGRMEKLKVFVVESKRAFKGRI